MCAARAARGVERLVARVAGREHGARAVGRAPQRAEHVTGLAVDADAAHALDRVRLLEAAHLLQLAGAARRGSARTRRRRRARRRELLRVHRRSPSAARDRERVEVDAERDAAELGVVPAADARRHLREQRPVLAEQHLRRRRPVLDAERARRRGGRLDRRADLGRLELGRPEVRERDAERRRRRLLAVGDRQRDEAPVERERVDRDDVAADELLDEAVLAARLGERDRGSGRASAARSRASPTPRSPARSGASITTGKPSSSAARETSSSERQTSERGCAMPAAASRSRCFSLETASDAASGVTGCGRPCRSAIAGRERDRVVGARARSTPSISSARASRSIAVSSSIETIARRSAYRKPGADGSRSADDDRQAARPRGGEHAELRGTSPEDEQARHRAILAEGSG